MVNFRIIYILLSLGLISGCGDDSEDQPCWERPANASLDKKSGVALKQDSKPSSYLVAFRAQGITALHFTSFKSEYKQHMSLLSDHVGGDRRIKSIDFITGVDLSKTASVNWRPSFPAPKQLGLKFGSEQIDSQLASIAQVEFASEDDASKLLDDWKQSGKTYFAEPNYISQPSVMEDNLYADYADFYAGMNQWWLSSIKLSDGFTHLSQRDQSQADIPTDAEILTNRPIVAILDSGVDYEHPALKANIWTNPDVNASRCPDDLHGCDTTNPEKGTLGTGAIHPFGVDGPGKTCFGKDPNCAHGTHVAGIVAGDPEWTSPESGLQTPGVCPMCQIMVLKIVSQIGEKSGILDSSILRAFKYVALNRRGSPDVRIINASFGKFVRSRSVGLLLRILHEKRSTLVIGAAGNEDSMAQEYPAAFSDAIAVSAVDRNLRKVEFSNFGRWVDISAPGAAIMSTVPGQGAEYKSGTSMASPMVAGVAGLMLTRFPDISYQNMRNWLVKSADSTFYKITENDGYNHACYFPKISQESVRQPLLGSGLLQAGNALKQQPTGEIPLFTDLDRVTPGCSVIKGGQQARRNIWTAFLLILMPMLVVGGSHMIPRFAKS